MQPLADIRLTLWEGGSLWLINAAPAGQAPPNATDFHAHHALQVTIARGGRFTLATGRERFEDGIVAVAPNAPHLFSAEGRVMMLFLEPESRLGRAVQTTYLKHADIAALPPRLLSELEADMEAVWSPNADEALIAATGLRIARALAGDTVAHTPDRRVRTLIAWAQANLERPISLSDGLPEVGLSASRLRHLFVEQTGLAFKSYLLWLRMHRAVERIVAGSTLTEAAHEAGFADSAHFSRTFRRMFGVPAAALRIL